MGKKIIIAVTNDLSGDQRIHRIATTLAENGFEVQVVGRKLPESQPLSPRIYQAHRMKLWFRRGKGFYIEYNLRLLGHLLRQKPEIINANDLDTLGAAYLAAKFMRAELIYDSHEYFTEVPELIGRPFTQKIWLLLESWIFPRLKKVYTVNHAIAQIYTQKYRVPVKVVRNLPLRRESLPTSLLSSRILLYQGALNIGRGLELMIETMNYLPEYNLHIIGRGDISEKLLKLVAEQEVKNVSFHGFIPFESLFKLTEQACLGMSLEEDRGANYRYSSPNKVYDYIQAGVPVLVSDLPVMREVVETYRTGQILPNDSRTPERLAEKIRGIVEDENDYPILKQNCRKAALELNWQEEQAVLLKIYQNPNLS
ncbi:MAG: glycosyltransferase [Bacteroidia bacterium]|nr:glycosyltransferase [Bacteroidia bacterium]